MRYYERLTLCPHEGKASFKGDRCIFFLCPLLVLCRLIPVLFPRHVLFNVNGLAQDFFEMVKSLFGAFKKVLPPPPKWVPLCECMCFIQQKDRAYRFSMHFLLELSQSLGEADRQRLCSLADPSVSPERGIHLSPHSCRSSSIGRKRKSSAGECHPNLFSIDLDIHRLGQR